MTRYCSGLFKLNVLRIFVDLQRDFLTGKSAAVYGDVLDTNAADLVVGVQSREHRYGQGNVLTVGEDLYSPYGTPASAVTKKKQNNLIAAARLYLRNNPTDKQPRMDVIEVYLKKGSYKVLEINHFLGAYHA